MSENSDKVLTPVLAMRT